jgi:hypothetical protein
MILYPRNTIGEPSYIIGSGLSGEPSAAVLDINGQLKWKIMAMMRWELDDGDERFVV